MEKQLLTLELHELMDRQIQLLQTLQRLLLDSQFIQGKVFSFPQPEQGNDLREDGPIYIDTVTGPAAVERAIFAWRHLFALPTESTRLVYRLPGALQLLPEEPDYLYHLVTQINHDRALFKERVLGADFLQHPNARYEFLHAHSMFPMMITLHMYRQIPLAPPGTRNVSFCWANKCSQSRTTRDAMIQLLSRSQDTPPPHVIDHDAWFEQLEEEKANLYSLPADTPLQIRRPLPVHPQMWVVSQDDSGTTKRQMFVASLPMLIIGDRTVKIGDFRDYNPLARRPSRQARITHEQPFNQRLWLYQVAR